MVAFFGQSTGSEVRLLLAPLVGRVAQRLQAQSSRTCCSTTPAAANSSPRPCRMRRIRIGRLISVHSWRLGRKKHELGASVCGERYRPCCFFVCGFQGVRQKEHRSHFGGSAQLAGDWKGSRTQGAGVYLFFALEGAELGARSSVGEGSL